MPEDRAVARWAAIIEGDWEKVYSYETPAYRKVYSVKQFRNGFGSAVEWNSISYASTEVLDKGVVKVMLDLGSTYEGLPFMSPIEERWLLKDGQWWHVQD